MTRLSCAAAMSRRLYAALAAGLALLTAAARTEVALAAGMEVVAGLEEVPAARKAVREAPETALTLMLEIFPASSLEPAGKAESALASDVAATICMLGLVRNAPQFRPVEAGVTAGGEALRT